jgi:1-acyl-sn-glycerol-3-phosphate acyltransferase
MIGSMARPLQVVRDESETLPVPVDDFGFDRAFTDRLIPLAEWVYRNYWRVEIDGIENVPGEGAALLVSNHAGVVAYDGAMIRTAIVLEHPQPRHARMLVLDWAFSVPFLSLFMRKTGNVLASPENARILLERGELVGVFPEGVKGASKPFRNRYHVQRFGRGGFMQVAIETGAPIIPVAVVGSEEIHPVLFDTQALARSLGLPALPITPTFPWLGPLGLIPLPSKWLISFGKPLDTRPYQAELESDPGIVLELTERIRERIQRRLQELLKRRPRAFF